MAAVPDNEQGERYPEPLEFFKRDAIHPDNQAILKREQMRWRLLGRWERWRLRRYVASLARQLRRGHYNDLVLKHHTLGVQFRRHLAAYRAASAANDESAKRSLAQLKRTFVEGRQVQAKLRELKPTYELYKHYAGWLDYEREHRRDLKAEAKREARIRKEMRQEAKWLESIMLDVFRKTDGCHYTFKKEGGKEVTRTPKFERSTIKPDAHWFYLMATKHMLWSWKWKLPNGVTIKRLTEEDVIENLRAATKRQVDAVWSDANQLMFRVSRLDSPDALPRLVKWRDAMKYFPQQRGLKFPYTIGVTDGRKFQWFDFASNPNVLVAGTAGSGKSNLINGFIATLASTHSPDELRIVMIDQKGGIEFTHWKELPHLLWEMVKTVDETAPMLKRLVAIMRQRMGRLEAVKAKDIAAYNTRVDEENRLERVLIVIDEMSTFVGLGALTEEIHNLIMLLVSQGRAVGVHMIACTQHPEVKVIPGRIKTNMSVRLSGWMPTISASQIILDSPEACRIPKLPGRFVAAIGMLQLIIQCPEITDEDIAGVVSATQHEYPDVRNDLRGLADQPAPVIWNEQRMIKAALEWTEGQLSADMLHKLLGEESPGERHLRKLKRSILDEWNSAEGVTDLEGHRIKIDRKRNVYYVRMIAPYSDNTDENIGTPATEAVSELASELMAAAD